MTQAHEERSFIDSEIRKRKRRKVKQDECWKEGWIEEVEEKIISRNIEFKNDCNDFELNAKNKLIMEYAQEHVDLTKGKKGDINKINVVRKIKEYVYHMRC